MLYGFLNDNNNPIYRSSVPNNSSNESQTVPPSKNKDYKSQNVNFNDITNGELYDNNNNNLFFLIAASLCIIGDIFIIISSELLVLASGKGTDWNYETSDTKERWSESSYETNNEKSTTNSWSKTQEHDVTCSASIEIPPSHKQTYSLLMNRYRGIVPTETDLKLTLCSAFIDPKDFIMYHQNNLYHQSVNVQYNLMNINIIESLNM